MPDKFDSLDKKWAALLEQRKKVERTGAMLKHMGIEKQIELLNLALEELPDTDPLKGRIASAFENLPSLRLMDQPEKLAFSQEMIDITLEALKIIQ
jgi:ABC-type antimicrobial peptide transport system ATPase subunit